MAAPPDWLTRPLCGPQRGPARLRAADLARRVGTGRARLPRSRVGPAAPGARPARDRARGRGRARPGRQPALLTLAADDLRAREEWLRAVHDAGAARVAFDPTAGTPLQGELTAALVAEVTSHKRGLACL